MEPSSSVTTSCPVAKCKAFGWTMEHAEADMTACTSAPWRINSRASFTDSTAAMLPVTARTIVFPWSLRLFAPRIRSAGCIARRFVGLDLYLWSPVARHAGDHVRRVREPTFNPWPGLAGDRPADGVRSDPPG